VDLSEEHDLAATDPAALQEIWAKLNTSNLELYGNGHSPAALLGNCNPACAKKYYDSEFGTPVCGVPGC
jgi:hypothetical protein